MDSWIGLKMIDIKNELANNNDSISTKKKLADVSMVIDTLLSEIKRIQKDIDNSDYRTETLENLEKEKEQNNRDLSKAQNILNKIQCDLDKIKEKKKTNKKILTLLLHLKYIQTNGLDVYYYENMTKRDIIDIVSDYNKHNIINMIETISLLHNTFVFYSDEYLWFKYSDFTDFVNNREDLIMYDNEDLIHVFNKEKLNKIKLISCARYISTHNSINIDYMNIQEATKKYLKWLCLSMTIDNFDVSNFIKDIDDDDLIIIANVCLEHYESNV